MCVSVCVCVCVSMFIVRNHIHLMVTIFTNMYMKTNTEYTLGRRCSR